jgi:hypothetical protein
LPGTYYGRRRDFRGDDLRGVTVGGVHRLLTESAWSTPAANRVWAEILQRET